MDRPAGLPLHDQLEALAGFALTRRLEGPLEDLPSGDPVHQVHQRIAGLPHGLAIEPHLAGGQRQLHSRGEHAPRSPIEIQVDRHAAQGQAGGEGNTDGIGERERSEVPPGGLHPHPAVRRFPQQVQEQGAGAGAEIDHFQTHRRIGGELRKHRPSLVKPRPPAG